MADSRRERQREYPLQLRPTDTAVWAEVHPAILADQVDPHVLTDEQPLAALQDLVEHRPGVRHGARDHLQDLGRSPELIESLLRLVEEAHVLDRDHRLVGKRREQRELPIAERAWSGTGHGDRAEHLVFTQHRRRGDRPRAHALVGRPGRFADPVRRRNVRDVNQFPTQYRPPGEAPIVERQRGVRRVHGDLAAGRRRERDPLDPISSHHSE